MRAGQDSSLQFGGDEAAQGKPREIAPAREHHDQQDGEEKARDGVADDDRGARPHVERRAVADRLGHAERDRHEVDDQRAPEAEGDRHRHLLDHQCQHRAIAEEALAEVEDGVALEHLPEAHVRGLVEAVELLQLLDEPRVEAARAAVPGRGAAVGRPAGLRHVAPAVAGHARGGIAARALQARDHRLDGAARGDLHDGEVQREDAEERRDDEQEPPEGVGEHALRGVAWPRAGRAAASAGSTHQVSKPSAYFGATAGRPNLFQ